MKPDTAILELVHRLRLPEQTQPILGFCQSNRPAKVAQWAEQLPAIRVNHTSVVLYQALPEVSRLDTTPGNRLQILEHLRPYVQQCIQGLTKSFLGQPLIMPDSAMKTATIAQALQKHTSNGYSLVVRGMIEKQPDGKFKDDSAKRLGLSIHRAISGMGLQLLRNSQIYTPVSNQYWLELYSLYALAETLDLLPTTYHDPLLKQQSKTSIDQAFQRVLLLACSHHSQLRQQETEIIYDALETWSSLCHLSPLGKDPDNRYAINLNDNLAPCYKSQLQGDNAPDTNRNALRELNLKPLLNSLKRIEEQGSSEHDPITIPASLGSRLLTHAIGAWGEEFRRYQPRKPSKNTLEIAVGIPCAHYHLAGQESFDSFLHERCQARNPMSRQYRVQGLSADYDPWDEAFDAEPGTRTHTEKPLNIPSDAPVAMNSKYPLYKIQISDISSGGFGLSWHQQIPSQVKTGELVAVRDPETPDWSLGVIRWVKQHKGMSQMGIQLIAQQAQAVAVQQLQKSGRDNVYMRGLSSSKAGTKLNEKALITASYPFRAGNKARLNNLGDTCTVQLSQLLYSSSSINLFRYRAIESAHRDTDGSDDLPPEAENFPEDW